MILSQSLVRACDSSRVWHAQKPPEKRITGGIVRFVAGPAILLIAILMT